MMTRWSGQQWYAAPRAPSGGAAISLLGMTEDEMKAVGERERHPIGFAPPGSERRPVKPRIRAKVRS